MIAFGYPVTLLALITFDSFSHVSDFWSFGTVWFLLQLIKDLAIASCKP